MGDRHPKRKAHNFIDLTLKRFGRLLVLRDSGLRKSRRPVWECQCDCGTRVNVLGKYLHRGDTRSCGCLAKEPSHNRDAVGGITLSFWTPIIRQADRRGIPFQIDRQYAWDLYEHQGRKCALSGVDICFSTNIRETRGTQTASLDRVDNSNGYITGNVQWVHKRVNIMKNTLSNSDLFAWCSVIQRWMEDHPDIARPSVGRGLPVVHTPAMCGSC